MFNLLPENLKREIKSDYRMRKLSVVLFFLIIIQISFLIFLLPTLLVSISREEDSIAKTEKMNRELLGLNSSPINTTIETINVKLNILSTNLDYPKLFPLLNTILSKVSGSITLDQIQYTATGTSTASMALTGTSKTRESLVAFAETLRSTNSFKQVDLPIANLVKDKNIKFMIDLTIQK